MSDKLSMSLDEIIDKKKKFNKKQINHQKFKPQPFKRVAHSDRPAFRRPVFQPRRPVLKEAKNHLFLSGLDTSMTCTDLRELFATYGNLKLCKIHWDNLGHSKGTGEIKYETADAAKEALENLNDTEQRGSKLSIRYYKFKA